MTIIRYSGVIIQKNVKSRADVTAISANFESRHSNSSRLTLIRANDSRTNPTLVVRLFPNSAEIKIEASPRNDLWRKITSDKNVAISKIP